MAERVHMWTPRSTGGSRANAEGILKGIGYADTQKCKQNVSCMTVLYPSRMRSINVKSKAICGNKMGSSKMETGVKLCRRDCEGDGLASCIEGDAYGRAPFRPAGGVRPKY